MGFKQSNIFGKHILFGSKKKTYESSKRVLGAAPIHACSRQKKKLCTDTRIAIPPFIIITQPSEKSSIRVRDFFLAEEREREREKERKDLIAIQLASYSIFFLKKISGRKQPLKKDFFSSQKNIILPRLLPEIVLRYSFFVRMVKNRQLFFYHEMREKKQGFLRRRGRALKKLWKEEEAGGYLQEKEKVRCKKTHTT